MKKLVCALTMVLMMAIIESGVFASDRGYGYTGVFRLYNTKTGEHLFTADANEHEILRSTDDWNSEGMVFMSHEAEGETPIYRLRHPQGKEHLYTTDLNEVSVLTSSGGWELDNNGQPMFYGSNPREGEDDWLTDGSYVYRLCNPATGLHLLTNDNNEVNALRDNGWTVDGDDYMFYALYPWEFY